MANYICDACKFQFQEETQPEQCPDCGKKAVREANEKEVEDFKTLLEKEDLWEN